jgi:hypothetical protein
MADPPQLPSEPQSAGVPDVRIADVDREHTVELLQHHCGAGLITLDEFSDRVGLAYAALTRSELDRVTADLPVRAGPVPESRRPRSRRWVVAVMSANNRKGRWRTTGRINVVAVMGGCHLDLRQAEFDTPVIEILALAVMGGIEITVPEGIEVELTGLPVMGGKDVRTADVPTIPGTPLVRVRAFPIMGGIQVRSRKSASERKAAGEIGRGRGPHRGGASGVGTARRQLVARRLGSGSGGAP